MLKIPAEFDQATVIDCFDADCQIAGIRVAAIGVVLPVTAQSQNAGSSWEIEPLPQSTERVLDFAEIGADRWLAAGADAVNGPLFLSK